MCIKHCMLVYMHTYSFLWFINFESSYIIARPALATAHCITIKIIILCVKSLKPVVGLYIQNWHECSSAECFLSHFCKVLSRCKLHFNEFAACLYIIIISVPVSAL